MHCHPHTHRDFPHSDSFLTQPYNQLLYHNNTNMTSRTPSVEQALPIDIPVVTAPRPQGDLFRVVKTLSAPTSSSGVYLCLPRDLPHSFEPSEEIDPDISDEAAEVHDALQRVSGNARLQQQLPLLSFKNKSDVLYKTMQENCTSKLPEKHLKMLPQLVVVKTRNETSELHNEVLQIEQQHKTDEGSTLHIGSYVLSSRFTASPSTSFVCLRPIFGPTLAQFGQASKKDGRGGIPAWFVSHISVGLIDSVAFLHDAGITHGKVELSNVMLNLYPTYVRLRYRGFPDVQLIDFSTTGPGSEEAMKADNRGILQVIEYLITECSDVVPFNGEPEPAGSVEVEDPLVTQLIYVEMMLRGDYDGYYNIVETRERAVDMRHDGPQTLPRKLMELLHADLVTAVELDSAVRDPVVLKTVAKKEALGKVLEDAHVTISGSGHAGTRTS
jgi:hypothetical protein